MRKSILFNEEDLLPETTGEPTLVTTSAFMRKLLILVGYVGDYSDVPYLRLEDAESILLEIKNRKL